MALFIAIRSTVCRILNASLKKNRNNNKSFLQKKEQSHEIKNLVSHDLNMECGLLRQNWEVFWGEELRVHLLWHVAIKSLLKIRL